MRVYKTGEIRNVAVVGHGASGKTSLVDALAFVAGTSKRHGSVKDGTALTDYTADEIERKYSINLALAVAEWMDTKLNLIDTPGYLDFTGDALAGIWAADGVVVVLRAAAGVEVGTEKVWVYCERRGVPRMFFVSLMDKEPPTSEGVRVGQAAAHAQGDPGGDSGGRGPEFHGIINLFSKKCHLYKKGTKAGSTMRWTSRLNTRSASRNTRRSCSRASRRPTTRCSSAIWVGRRSGATRRSGR
jgi:elongation factor G